MTSDRNFDDGAKSATLTEMAEELKKLNASEKVLIEMSSRLRSLAKRVSQDANVPSKLEEKNEAPKPDHVGYLEAICELNDSINQELDQSMHTLEVLEKFI